MKKLWKFELENSYGFIGGLFTATDEEVQNIIGKEFYLEGYLKYIELSGSISKEEITLVSDNPVVVETVGNFGLNPLEFADVY